MTLLIKKFNYEEIKKESVNGKRLYACPDGNSVASVTTILDKTKDKTSLIEWRKRVGETKANEIATEAASIGTRMHKFLEDYVETGNWPSAGSNPYSQQANKMATTIKDKALSKIDEIWGSEVQLYHPKIYAGTTDLVGVFNGAESIMDFKQTNKPKKEEWVEDYKLQLTAYALAHNEIYGTNIQEGHVFMCSRNNEYQQFDIYPDEFKSWESKWWDRVYLYYDQFA
jgi:genome maintenance exonuclease 1|tara:strand:+ start:12177 stop:12857 length:681 start_codon:yes stop_codon:yes gene_type:complete